jgi:hypothetical protein
MRLIFSVLLLCCLLSAPAAAQPNMEDMDFPPLMTEDGFRIFFDASVTWMFGGIISNPIWEFWQTQPLVDAYLVLTHPTAEQLGGFRVRSQILGNHVVTGWEVLGSPVSVQVVGDEIQVAYAPVFPLDGSPVTLIHWGIFNSPFDPVSFFLMPPEGYATPIYFDGMGSAVPAETFNGAFHDYQAPAVVLNGFVTPVASSRWGSVKALFR